MKRHNDQRFVVGLLSLVAFFFVAFQVRRLFQIDVSYLGEHLPQETILVYLAFLCLIPIGLGLLVWLPGLAITSLSWPKMLTNWPTTRNLPIKQTVKTVVLTHRYHPSTLQVVRC